MEPCFFDEANLTMAPPDGMTEDQVQTIRVQRAEVDGMPVVISCFKPTQDELDEIQRTGRVWLTVLGHAMPPVILGAVKLA